MIKKKIVSNCNKCGKVIIDGSKLCTLCKRPCEEEDSPSKVLDESTDSILDNLTRRRVSND
jgi:hypothetical protein